MSEQKENKPPRLTCHFNVNCPGELKLVGQKDEPFKTAHYGDAVGPAITITLRCTACQSELHLTNG